MHTDILGKCFHDVHFFLGEIFCIYVSLTGCASVLLIIDCIYRFKKKYMRQTIFLFYTFWRIEIKVSNFSAVITSNFLE